MAYLLVLLLFCIPLAAFYGFIHLTQRGMGRVPSHSVSLALTAVAAAFLLTLASTFVAVDVTSENQRAADFGYPISFVTADTSYSVPEGRTSRLGYDPWEYPAEFHWMRFFASWALVAGALLAAVILLAAARRRARGRLPHPSARRS